MPALKAIDVFSGIGGLSLALDGIMRTVLYCELDAFCRRVLVDRMRSGDLERAPIHSDIRDLQLPPDFDAQALVGGFPCQDISSMGLQRGIVAGKRSSMFFEMMRLVDACPSIQVVFLENVGNITKCGLKEIIEECCLKMGFNLMWTMRSARDIGAPHVRQRWFGLACRDGFTFDLGDDALPARFDWASEPNEKCTFKPAAVLADASWDPLWARRSGALGNAVVPCAARSAFLDLARMQPSWNNVAQGLHTFSVDLSSGCVQEFPDNGLVVAGRLLRLPETVCSAQEVRQGVCFDVLVGPDYVVSLSNLPTPRHGNTHPAAMTERAVRDLPTVLVNCKECVDVARSRGVVVAPGKMSEVAVPNVNYIEWMMGFPKNWTKVSGDDQAVDGGKDGKDGAPTEAPVETVPQSATAAAAPWKNGFHMFMEANPGKKNTRRRSVVAPIARCGQTRVQGQAAIMSTMKPSSKHLKH